MQNDKEWFCSCVNSCQSGIYALAYSVLQNDEDAKDAIQDTLFKAYSNLDSLRDRKKFKPWIMKILANTAYEMLRRRKNYEYLDWQVDDSVLTDDDDIDTKLSLWEAVQALKMPYRSVIVLFYYEDLSINEISGITGSKPSAIKKQLSRAREQLRKQLQKEAWTR